MRAGILCTVVVCLLAAGCGGDEAEATPEEAVRATLTGFVDGVQDKRYDVLCEDVFAPELVDGLQEVGLTCPVALQRAFQDVRSPQLSIDRVEVAGDEATARVRTSALGEAPSADTVQLVRTQAGWRVSSLG